MSTLTDTNRTILHVDMDAFFASVELLRHPELRGQPVIVGAAGPRGVVAAASYEARSYGVHSAMPSVRATRLCPDAVFLAGDHGLYAEVSARVMAVFADFTPLVEPLSLDEAFLDVTGARRTHGEGHAIAAAIRARVLDQEQLTCSVGVATSKFLAKLATEEAKPSPSREGPVFGSGVHVVEPGRELEFLHPLPVRALWGVGPATLAKLERLGVSTVGELAALPVHIVTGAVGAAVGTHLHELANGYDDRSVVPNQEAKSISHEETFRHDLHDRDDIRREIVRLSDGVATRLRRAGRRGRTVTLKVRFADFHTITRSTTLAAATDSGRDIIAAAAEMMEAIDPSAGLRLIGVGVTGLRGAEQPEAEQLRFDEPDSPGSTDSSWRAAEDTVDDIRRRFGEGVIGPAVLADDGGLRVKRRGDQQWGPDDPARPDRP